MNAREANALLTTAALADPRVKPDADVAERWAELLADVSLRDGLQALTIFQRDSTDWLVPASLRPALRSIAERKRRAAREDERALERAQEAQRRELQDTVALPQLRSVPRDETSVPLVRRPRVRPNFRDPAAMAAAAAELDALREQRAAAPPVG